ncbi:hypothetical protein ACFYOD_38725 [Streptomyces sp. NPDC006703]|uniref:hypothetical protein n=1 Tax=Streptomyces sp. NPDC006703 TaxID=3364759 RepID=UPI00369E5C1D
MKNQTRSKALRRKSTLILSWVFTLCFGFAGLLIAEVNSWEHSGPMSGTAACFGTVALARRVWGSRIVMAGQLVIVNPVFTYRIPYRSIRNVSANDRGSLIVQETNENFLYASAFSGSLIDMLTGSTDRAVKSINEYRHATSLPESSTSSVRTVTRAWSADAFLVAAIACAVYAGTLGS